MDLTGAAYFYTLAQIGITFAGFAAILMTIRQMRGVSMSKFHLWVARSYVQSGMVTAMNAMLSPLLFALGLSERLTWQVASIFIAIQSVILIALAPRQWRAATDRPLQMRVKIQIGFGLAINAGLLANAIGWPFEPMGGLVMLAVSWNLFAFFAQFAESIRFFFEEETAE
ncbi:MAG TPA: hypothetical protein VHT51_21500 [Micropepsaceae bacterium]|jgi:hypothetical protein|nr:hypothetical protein [Micropepsaceae bacterium]